MPGESMQTISPLDVPEADGGVEGGGGQDQVRVGVGSSRSWRDREAKVRQYDHFQDKYKVFIYQLRTT